MTNYTTDTELTHARTIVMKYGWNSFAYQILNKGIKLWFSRHSEAVIGYQEFGNYRIVAGAPICSLSDLPAVIHEFEHEPLLSSKHTCYFCAGTRLAKQISSNNSSNYMVLGAEPVWNPQSWETITKSKPSLRAQISRAMNKGVTVSMWDNELAATNPFIQKCLSDWLTTRGLPPLHFLIESQTLDRLYDRRVYVAERENMPVGFVVLSPIPNRNGWLVEQNIRGNSAPNGTIERLLSFAAHDVASIGADFFTLGLSPLSHHGTHGGSTNHRYSGLLQWLRAHGRRFYNFEGLDAFKAKFQPDFWEPIYAITNEKRITLSTLHAIAGAFAGMSPIKLGMIALVRALRKELDGRK